MSHVKVNKLPYRFSGEKWPVIEGYKNINVCSGAQGIRSQLSPMKLGPVVLSDYFDMDLDPEWLIMKNEPPLKAYIFENFWQYSKVYKNEIDENNDLTETFFKMRRDGFMNKKGIRRKYPKGCNCLFSIFGEEKLPYLDARYYYCKIYTDLVKKTDAYKKLKEMVKEGTKIQILGYDGYNKGKNSYKFCYKDESRPFGHEFVLACLLTKNKVWEN